MKIFVLLLLVGGIVFVVSQLPVVTGGGIRDVRKELTEVQTVELSGKTLFISDLHLTADIALNEQFTLDFSDVQNVVIVGDFFHSAQHFATFGSGNEERFRNVLEEIVPPDFSGKVFYIIALTHDPQGLETRHLSFPNFDFSPLGEYGKFTVNGIPVVAYHGHQLHSGMIGGGIGWLGEKLGFPLVLEKLGKSRFGIDENTWVINGHSHVPGIDRGAKVANTGSFVGAPFNKLIFRLHIGTGILFDLPAGEAGGDRVELQKYEGLNLKNLYPFAL